MMNIRGMKRPQALLMAGMLMLSASGGSGWKHLPLLQGNGSSAGVPRAQGSVGVPRANWDRADWDRSNPSSRTSSCTRMSQEFEKMKAEAKSSWATDRYTLDPLLATLGEKTSLQVAPHELQAVGGSAAARLRLLEVSHLCLAYNQVLRERWNVEKHTKIASSWALSSITHQWAMSNRAALHDTLRQTLSLIAGEELTITNIKAARRLSEEQQLAGNGVQVDFVIGVSEATRAKLAQGNVMQLASGSPQLLTAFRYQLNAELGKRGVAPVSISPSDMSFTQPIKAMKNAIDGDAIGGRTYDEIIKVQEVAAELASRDDLQNPSPDDLRNLAKDMASIDEYETAGASLLPQLYSANKMQIANSDSTAVSAPKEVFSRLGWLYRNGYHGLDPTEIDMTDATDARLGNSGFVAHRPINGEDGELIVVIQGSYNSKMDTVANACPGHAIRGSSLLATAQSELQLLMAAGPDGPSKTLRTEGMQGLRCPRTSGADLRRSLKGVNVQLCWHNIARDIILQLVRILHDKKKANLLPKFNRIVVTGHSLGAAVSAQVVLMLKIFQALCRADRGPSPLSILLGQEAFELDIVGLTFAQPGSQVGLREAIGHAEEAIHHAEKQKNGPLLVENIQPVGRSDESCSWSEIAAMSPAFLFHTLQHSIYHVKNKYDVVLSAANIRLDPLRGSMGTFDFEHVFEGDLYGFPTSRLPVSGYKGKGRRRPINVWVTGHDQEFYLHFVADQVLLESENSEAEKVLYDTLIERVKDYYPDKQTAVDAGDWESLKSTRWDWRNPFGMFRAGSTPKPVERVMTNFVASSSRTAASASVESTRVSYKSDGGRSVWQGRAPMCAQKSCSTQSQRVKSFRADVERY